MEQARTRIEKCKAQRIIVGIGSSQLSDLEGLDMLNINKMLFYDGIDGTR